MRTKRQIDILRDVGLGPPAGVASTVSKSDFGFKQGGAPSFLPEIVTARARQMASENGLKSFYVKSGFMDKTSQSIKEIHDKAIKTYMEKLSHDEQKHFLPPVAVKFKKRSEKINVKTSTLSEAETKISKLDKTLPKYFTEGISSMSRRPKGSLILSENRVKPENLPATISMTRENGQIVISVSLQENDEKAQKKIKQNKTKLRKVVKQKLPLISSVQIGADADLASADKFYYKSADSTEQYKPTQRKQNNKSGDNFFMENMASFSPTSLEPKHRHDPLQSKVTSLGGTRLGDKLPPLIPSTDVSTSTSTLHHQSESDFVSEKTKLHEIRIGDGLLINHFVFGMRHDMVYAKRFEKKKHQTPKQPRPIGYTNAELGISKLSRNFDTSDRISKREDNTDRANRREDNSKRPKSGSKEEKRLGYPHIVEIKPPPSKKSSFEHTPNKDDIKIQESTSEKPVEEKMLDSPENETEVPEGKPPTIPGSMRKTDISEPIVKQSSPKKLPKNMRPSPSPPTVPPNTAERKPHTADSVVNTGSDFAAVREEGPFTSTVQTPEIIMTPAPNLDCESEDEVDNPRDLGSRGLFKREGSNNSFLGVPDVNFDSDSEKMRPPSSRNTVGQGSP